MGIMERSKRRRRGIILTVKGLDKLQQAKQTAEYREKRSQKFTLEELSEKTQLAVDTLMKVFGCESRVDRQTLKNCFSAFNLKLEKDDYYYPEEQNEDDSKARSFPEGELTDELPEGQVPLGSAYYLEREFIDDTCFKAIAQPGSLIRIKAPKKMGKTSLLMRILEQANKQDYQTVYLTLQLAEYKLLDNLDKFLQWFCANISIALGLPNRVADYWDSLIGNKMSCKFYMEHYILTNVSNPIVIGLDDIDRLFAYRDLADDFFGLLRAWHEEAKNRPVWQKLRLVVIHSTEVYIPLNLNQSPFNVGLAIEIPPLTAKEVQELATRYYLDWSIGKVEKLMSFVGGNPFLIRQALYHIARGNQTLDQVLLTPVTADNNIYKEHLERQLWRLQHGSSELIEAWAKVVVSAEPVELEVVSLFKLQSLGLIDYQGNLATPSCKLYAQYFREYFRTSSSYYSTIFI